MMIVWVDLHSESWFYKAVVTLAQIPLRLLARTLRSSSVLIGGFLILSIGLSVFEGDRNFTSYHTTQRQLQVAEATLVKLQADRDMLEHKVAALRPNSLDTDLLEEQVRSRLGYVRQGEVVVLGQ